MDSVTKGLLLIIILAVNIVAFAMYGIDKKKAIQKGWRISERSLLGIAFCFGSLGALLGMRFFRHKTKHTKFVILVPVALTIQVILLLAFFR